MDLFINAAVLLCLLPAVIGSNGAGLTIEPNERILFFEKGTEQKLKCSVTYTGIASHKLTWMFNGGEITQPASSSVVIDRQKNTATLKNNIVADKAGKYTCQFRNETSKEMIKSQSIELNTVMAELGEHEHKRRDVNDSTVTESTVTDTNIVSTTPKNTPDNSKPKFKETKKEPLYEYPSEKETLSCDVEIPSLANPTISSPEWYKNGSKIADKQDKRFKFENNSLIIDKPTRKDAGMYIAKFTVKQKGAQGTEDKTYEYPCHVALQAKPFVMPFEKSKNLIQEDDMDLRCDVMGYPPAVVAWFKDNQVINESMGERVKLTTLNGYKNARLTITKVDYDDAGTYKCLATSAALKSNASNEVVVRVKDKLAALWPFLGIVGEVVVLCTIIFIYEKRRNKQADQANNDAHEADPTEKKSNVRNRRNQK